METKIARLETAVEFIQRDVANIKGDIRDLKADIRDVKAEIRDVEKTALSHFHIMFGALISVSLGLAALMAKGFQWI